MSQRPGGRAAAVARIVEQGYAAVGGALEGGADGLQDLPLRAVGQGLHGEGVVQPLQHARHGVHVVHTAIQRGGRIFILADQQCPVGTGDGSRFHRHPDFGGIMNAGVVVELAAEVHAAAADLRGNGAGFTDPLAHRSPHRAAGVLILPLDAGIAGGVHSESGEFILV